MRNWTVYNFRKTVSSHLKGIKTYQLVVFYKSSLFSFTSNPDGASNFGLLFFKNSDSLGKPTNESLFFPPVLLFLLTVDCPNITEFWVPCVSRYVGFSFWPLAPRSCEKWFSTMSWLTMAGLTTDPGNLLSFVLTIAEKPRIMDCKSKNNFEEINSLSLADCCCHSVKNSRAWFKSRMRLSLAWNMPCFVENSSTILLVWPSKFIVESSLVGFSQLTVWRWSLYALKQKSQ